MHHKNASFSMFFLSFSGDLVNLGSEYMCDFSQGTCNWTASVGKMKWIQSQVVFFYSCFLFLCQLIRNLIEKQYTGLNSSRIIE